MITVILANPISGAPIRECTCADIKELNAFLAYLAEIKLYAYRIQGHPRTYGLRAA